ncbi:single-stranded DNA-binding protein [Escherichia coli]|uniref:single-stranded DNA-binding protein n=1 Tax=Escherichia coli TaxID=562 RepID=UPI003DA78C36
MNSPQNFAKPGKEFCVLPGQVRQAVAVMPAAKVLKQVMVNTRGNKEQVPAKRQEQRLPRNSTDDGG